MFMPNVHALILTFNSSADVADIVYFLFFLSPSKRLACVLYFLVVRTHVGRLGGTGASRVFRAACVSCVLHFVDEGTLYSSARARALFF